jgi:hypothetical protein
MSTIHYGDVSVSPGTSITGAFKFDNGGNATGAVKFDNGEVVEDSADITAPPTLWRCENYRMPLISRSEAELSPPEPTVPTARSTSPMALRSLWMV